MTTNNNSYRIDRRKSKVSNAITVNMISKKTMAITVEAGAVKFNLADFINIQRYAMMRMMVGIRTGVSGEDSINMSSLLEQRNNNFVKSYFKLPSSLSGKSRLNSEWKTPCDSFSRISREYITK